MYGLDGVFRDIGAYADLRRLLLGTTAVLALAAGEANAAAVPAGAAFRAATPHSLSHIPPAFVTPEETGRPRSDAAHGAVLRFSDQFTIADHVILAQVLGSGSGSTSSAGSSAGSGSLSSVGSGSGSSSSVGSGSLSSIGSGSGSGSSSGVGSGSGSFSGIGSGSLSSIGSGSGSQSGVGSSSSSGPVGSTSIPDCGSGFFFNGAICLPVSDPGEPVVVPEPSTLALIGSGLLGYALLRRRRSPRPASKPGTLPPRPGRLDDPS